MPIDSALALCISFASALRLYVPDTVDTGSYEAINATIEEGDPDSINLVLVWPHGSDNATLASNVSVALTMYVDIPKVPTG